MSASSQPTSSGTTSDGTTGYGNADARTGAPPSPWVTGLVWFAGTVMIVAGFSLFIPYCPVGAILIIALAVFAIWALRSYYRDAARR
jgi:hypothetical protein